MKVPLWIKQLRKMAKKSKSILRMPDVLKAKLKLNNYENT